MSADHVHAIETRPSREPRRSLTVKFLREEFWIYDELWKRIQHHIELCEKQIKWFSKWALFNRYSLPLLTATASGFASVLAGIQGNSNTRWPVRISIVVVIVSFFATIISALNAAMRPALQYGHYVRFINRFWTQRLKLEIEAEQAFLSTNSDDDVLRLKIHEVIVHSSAELDKTIEDFSEESVSNIGIPAADKET